MSCLSRLTRQTAADQGSPAMAPKKNATSEMQLERILSSLTDDKAEEIVQIDLRGKSAIGDYMVICSGRSTRQVAAMSEKLAERLKQESGRIWPRSRARIPAIGC